jgi:acyl-homoserine-lactone acylase
MGIPERSKIWYKVQSPEYKNYIDAFVQGMNDYAKKNRRKIANNVRIVLPVTAVDIMAYLQRVWHVIFLGGGNFNIANYWARGGSNAWAIAPSRSASGNAMLLSNPHLSWKNVLRWFEAHLVGPTVNAYGAGIPGMPFLIMGFNNYLGWTNTVNTMDGADLYELTLKEGGYSWDGGIEQFERETVTLKIKKWDESFEEKKIEILKSIHGPVVAQKKTKAVAIRIAGLDQPHMIKQIWDIKRAANLNEFENAVSRLQVPLLNFLYADKEGHIMYLFGGRTPKRSGGTFSQWSRIVSGTSSANLWTETLGYDELPKVIDPPTGWLQNTNDPPWACTFPGQLDPADFPRYLAPYRLHFRSQRSIKTLMQDEKITYDEFIQYKMSTRMEMADRILDDLFAAVDLYGSEKLQPAVSLLKKWDGCADAGSRGAVLFWIWVKEVGRNMFAVQWDPKKPLTTPDGLDNPEAAVKALEKAVQKTRSTYGSIDIPWGEVFRLRYAGKDFPASGGPGELGIFPVLTFASPKDNKYQPIHGEGYIALIEFGKTVKAQVLMTYGNSTQPGSPHVGDQLELFSRKKFRFAWLTPKEIKRNLEFKESLTRDNKK